MKDALYNMLLGALIASVIVNILLFVTLQKVIHDRDEAIEAFEHGGMQRF